MYKQKLRKRYLQARKNENEKATAKQNLVKYIVNKSKLNLWVIKKIANLQIPG